MKTLVCWSGGKDSTLALARLREGGSAAVAGLLTSFSAEFDRVSMHGVRRELLEAQAAALGLPVSPVFIPTPPPAAACPLTTGKTADGYTVFATNDEYEKRMLAALRAAREAGTEAVAFGDIYLADLRAYREALLKEAGLTPLFPLWGEPPASLARECVARGVKAITTCVDGNRLGKDRVGRALDADFFATLPESVDACGERGEYHTFVHDGPGFTAPVQYALGEIVHRPPFWFCDLLPARGESRLAGVA